MSATDLQAYVNATSTDDIAFVESCWAEASELVDAYVAGREVPADPLRRAVLEVGAELFHRRQAPGGITQFATIDGPAPVRMARDPMLPAYPILARYVGGGFA